MRLVRSVSLLAGFCLLAWAATASAECAWVLWERHAEASGVDGWSPWGRYLYYETNAHCWTKITDLTFIPKEGSLADKAAYLFGTGVYRQQTNAARSANGVTLFLGERANRSVSYLCLPDTVDPRGPKAGATKP